MKASERYCIFTQEFGEIERKKKKRKAFNSKKFVQQIKNQWPFVCRLDAINLSGAAFKALSTAVDILYIVHYSPPPQSLWLALLCSCVCVCLVYKCNAFDGSMYIWQPKTNHPEIYIHTNMNFNVDIFRRF